MNVFCAISLGIIVAIPLHAQAPVVRDSAGIRIVTNQALSAAKETFRFHPERIYDVGGLEDDPAKEFKSDQGYLRGVFLSDGSLAVTDEWRMQFFDRQAKRIDMLGTKGAGPGDFLYLVGLCRTRGDTLVTYDTRNARFAVISPARKVIRTFSAGRNRSASASFCLDDGTIVLAHSDFDRAALASATQYVRARLDGSVVNTLYTAPREPFDLVTTVETATATAGQRFFHGLPGGSQITAYSTTGKPVLIIRLADRPEKITDQSALARMGYPRPAGGERPTEAEIAALKAKGLEQWKSMPHAEYWPIYGEILADELGRLWVNQYRIDLGILLDTWVAFAPDGRMIGKLVLPKGPMQVIGFGKSTILVRTADSDGAAHLEVHSIVKP